MDKTQLHVSCYSQITMPSILCIKFIQVSGWLINCACVEQIQKTCFRLKELKWDLSCRLPWQNRVWNFIPTKLNICPKKYEISANNKTECRVLFPSTTFTIFRTLDIQITQHSNNGTWQSTQDQYKDDLNVGLSGKNDKLLLWLFSVR